MKKNNNMTSFIIVTGILVVVIFVGILAINLLPNYESNSYYVKVDDEMRAKIETLDIKDSKLSITTSGDAYEYCVKSTRSTPESSNICWKKIDSNTATISIYKYKKYYVWIKDINGNISSPISINMRNSD